MSFRRLAGLLLLGLLCCAQSVISATVTVVSAPANALAPDVAVDRDGTVHMVYGLGNDAFYIQSTDNGKTFTRPVKLNTTLQVTTSMGERGPKISVAGDGIIHVVWPDKWSPGVTTYGRYTRSTDGGKTFEAPKQIADLKSPDGLTMAADKDGNVLVFFHTMTEPKPADPQATWLYLARSTDHGVTFQAPEKVKIDTLTGSACSMCATRARIGGDGNVYLAFRSAMDNVRDFWMLKSAKTENNFTAVRANKDNWIIPTCPMCGPELTFSPTGRALMAFMSRNKVYWAISNDKRAAFELHVATPGNELNEIYPSAWMNRAGDVLFAWQVGPMSVNSTAVVKWALYKADGTLQSQQASTVGTSFSGTKATAFVGKDDNFYLVTTAR